MEIKLSEFKKGNKLPEIPINPNSEKLKPKTYNRIRWRPLSISVTPIKIFKMEE